ncbi:MAG: hypothetical protein ACPH9T_12370 [Paracoccaceae bacterium]
MTFDALRADKDTIARFISEITRDWSNHSNEDGLFEVRCLGKERTPVIKSFELKECDDAVDLAVQMNNIGLNIYMTINPIKKSSVCKAAKDGDILRAHYTFVDADDKPGINGLEALTSKIEPDLVVITGTIPHQRRHAYWRFDEPCTDLTLWSNRQLDLAKRYKTDPAVSNPSRIMRVAGTVSYPDLTKQARGYVNELTEMRVNTS